MHKQHQHVIERTGYVVILLVLVSFPLVGQFIPNPEAANLDQLLQLLAVLGLVLFGLGRWILKPSRPGANPTPRG